MEHFELINITDRKTIEWTREQNSVQWKGILSVSDYILRDHVLGQTEMYCNPPCYVLINKDTKEKVCALEIAVRDGLRFDNIDGHVTKRKINTGCIGSVFTYPQYRRKGYAKIMIDKIIELGKTQLIKDGYISLYSEIGEYYQKSGFKSFHVPLLTRPITNKTPYIFQSHQETYLIDDIEVSLVKFRDFETLVEFYKNHNYQQIESNCGKDGKSRVTIDVNQHIFNWFHIRAKLISYKTFYNNKDIQYDNINDIIEKFQDIEPIYFGMKFKHNGKLFGYVSWTFEWSIKDKQYHIKLYILHLFTLPEYESYKEKIIGIIDDYLCFVNTTAKFGTFTVISAWASDITNQQFKGIEIVNDSLSAMIMMDDNDQQKLVNGDLIWENNNRIPWF